jgi:hypothetical protein
VKRGEICLYIYTLDKQERFKHDAHLSLFLWSHNWMQIATWHGEMHAFAFEILELYTNQQSLTTQKHRLNAPFFLFRQSSVFGRSHCFSLLYTATRYPSRCMCYIMSDLRFTLHLACFFPSTFRPQQSLKQTDTKNSLFFLHRF